jgi:hypothetical protein
VDWGREGGDREEIACWMIRAGYVYISCGNYGVDVMFLWLSGLVMAFSWHVMIYDCCRSFEGGYVDAQCVN